MKLKKQLEHHKFHYEVIENGKTYRKWGTNKIIHPLPTIDQGWYQVNCTTDLSAYDPKQVAKMVIQINDKSSNAFMQQIRRRINILERPLVTARGDGKSYIYANFNPQYAQYALTILRTFYNFCYPFKMGSKEKLTPAQRIGLTDKQVASLLLFSFLYQSVAGGKFMIQKLGFTANDRLLIINADDFGITKGTNEAIINLFEEKSITSTSIMIPCSEFK